jgi:pimeloyl-ACP methyl ester carboxylesterase
MKTVPKETGFYRTKDGADLYYEVRGEGAPIIFVYGIACLMNHWHHQIHYFSQEWKVYSYDLRGHVKSTSPNPEKLSIQGLAEDLIELMDHWGLEKAHLVGHSFGVPVLVKAYELAPERVKSFAFVNGFAHNPIKGMFGLDVVEPFFYFAKSSFEKNPELWKIVWKSAVENPLAILFSGVTGGFNLKLTQLKDIEVYARGVAHMPLENFLRLFEDMMSFDGRETASKISVPTLIMTGDRDFVTPLKFQEDLHHAIKGSTLVRIPYGSHCCQLDFPDYVNLKLERHLRDAEAAAAKGKKDQIRPSSNL